MTASLHKLTAGDGYTYLTDQVAANDSTERSQSEALADYYSAKGEAPGTWRGSGLSGLGIESGSMVSEAQMKALFGEGIHPDADRILVDALKDGATKEEALERVSLGRGFRDAGQDLHPFVTKLAERFAAFNAERGASRRAAIPVDDRARMRSDVAVECFTEEMGRAPMDARELAGYVARASRPRQQSTAGFDVTFSPVKSVSSLWAIAPVEVSKTIEAAHDAAVSRTLSWLEKEVAYTRRGAGGAVSYTHL